MAELEIREPGGDGRAGAANVGFQTSLSFPTLSGGSNLGREAGHIWAGLHKGLGREDQQAGV